MNIVLYETGVVNSFDPGGLICSGARGRNHDVNCVTLLDIPNPPRKRNLFPSHSEQ